MCRLYSSGKEEKSDQGKNFAAHVHQHDSTPFFGVAEIALLRYWDALAYLPGFMICLAFKEVQNVFVDSSFWRIDHGVNN